MSSVSRLLLNHEQRKARRRRATAPDPTADAGAEGNEQDISAEALETLRSIRNVVVLMMENHSFDNYFGMMTGVDGHQGKATHPNRTGSGRTTVDPYHLPDTSQYPQVPTQSWYASHLQYDQGRCDGFVKSIEATFPRNSHRDVAMGYWTDEDIPFYYQFAREFTVADQWFASCLGPTLPNRRFLVAGTANGLIDDAPYRLLDRPAAGTIFDSLSAHGISWANYHHASTWRALLKRGPFRLASSQLQFTADVYPLDALARLNHLRPIRRLQADIERGALPELSIIDPDFDHNSEENPQDIHHGQDFARTVIEQLRQGPQWQHTVLIWCYDEHGGYYDHVPPPAAVRPDDIDGRSITDAPWPARLAAKMTGSYRALRLKDRGDKRYDRLGFRVPAVIAGPHAKNGYVSHTTYDHTSILKLIELIWGLPPLTQRDAAATAPLDCLALAAPRPPPRRRRTPSAPGRRATVG
jgi:phospholipase C